MKKLLGIFMAAVTVIAACAGFVGCNKGDTGQGAEEPPKTEEPAENTQEPSKEEPAVVGEFKSLKDAYEAGWLTHDDLKSIAYYFNYTPDHFNDEHYQSLELHDENDNIIEYVRCPEEGFVPKPHDPNWLSTETKNNVKRAFRSDLPIEKINLGAYYGTYKNCVVVAIGVRKEYDPSEPGCADPAPTNIRFIYRIGDITFYDEAAKAIGVWNPNVSE